MKNKKNLLFFSIFALIFILNLAIALSVPSTMNRHMILRDSDGTLLTGSYFVNTTFFDKNNASFFSENISISFYSGIGDATYGLISVLKPHMFLDYPMTIDTYIGGERMNPVINVSSVPYAFVSGIAENISCPSSDRDCIRKDMIEGVDCHNISGGSDINYCIDATGTGGGTGIWMSDSQTAYINETVTSGVSDINVSKANVTGLYILSTDFYLNDLSFINYWNRNKTDTEIRDLVPYNSTNELQAISVGGEVSGTVGSITLAHDALDDQYYDSESDLTGLLDDNYKDINTAGGNTSAEILEITKDIHVNITGDNLTGLFYIDNSEIATLSDLTTGNVTITSIVVVKNTEAGTMSAGEPVYFVGYISGLSRQNVLYANNTAFGTHADCIISETITSGTFGQCVVSGHITGMDTSSWSFGDDLYLNESDGTLINYKPRDAVCIQKIGMVLRDHTSQGVIWVSGAGRCNDVSKDINITGDVNASDLAGNLQWEYIQNVPIMGNTSAEIKAVVPYNTTDEIFRVSANDSYVLRNLWTTIDNYPSACSGNQFVSGLGDTLTCLTLTNYSQAEINAFETDASHDECSEITNCVENAYDSINDIPNATSITDGETNKFAVVDVIYDWVIGLDYVANAYYTPINLTNVLNTTYLKKDEGLSAGNITSGELPDARVSDTLTCSDLVAGSEVVADSEVVDTITIDGGIIGSNTISEGAVQTGNWTMDGGNMTLKKGIDSFSWTIENGDLILRKN